MKSTARAAPVKNYRLPHISFAGRLEKELMVGSKKLSINRFNDVHRCM